MRTQSQSELHFSDTTLFINSFSAFGQARYGGVGTAPPGVLASATFVSANRALYLPLWLPFAYPVRRIFWCNGATANGNTDAGIYNESQQLIYSTGATAQAGTNAPQYTTLSPELLLQPGFYWLAISHSNTTGTFFRSQQPGALGARAASMYEQAAAHPLPATMTPAAVTGAYVPLMGITRTTSGF